MYNYIPGETYFLSLPYNAGSALYIAANILTGKVISWDESQRPSKIVCMAF